MEKETDYNREGFKVTEWDEGRGLSRGLCE